MSEALTLIPAKWEAEFLETCKGPRRSGRTTRLADLFIKILMEDGSVTIVDHLEHEDRTHDRAKSETRKLLEIVKHRLMWEHKYTFVFFGIPPNSHRCIEISPTGRTLKILQNA